MGIDEAGRGPVLGPMVYSALIWRVDFDHKKELVGFNINDSKKVLREDRERAEAFLQILCDQKVIDYKFTALMPQ